MTTDAPTGQDLSGRRAVGERTAWNGVFLSSLIPLIVAAGFVYAARNPPWEDDGPVWVSALFALIPLEIVRAIMLWILGETFARWQGPRKALRDLGLQMAAFAVVCLIIAFSTLKTREFIALMTSLQTWEIVLPLVALLVADAVITVAFFGGDPARAAARLEAASDDSGEMAGMMLFPVPFVLALAYGALLLARNQGLALAAWVPDLDVDDVRALGLYYAAGYFVLKAFVLSRVYTAAFARDGRRLFARRWIIWLFNRDPEERRKSWAEEEAKLRRRQRLLAGELVPPLGEAPPPRRRRTRSR